MFRSWFLQVNIWPIQRFLLFIKLVLSKKMLQSFILFEMLLLNLLENIFKPEIGKMD